VTSPWPLRGSPKRAVSALQPAAPIAISANALARNHGNARNNSAEEFMACSLERNNNWLS
jgi:hypothetical protein